ncbi:diguanylate cyclase (GGDEF)-like protein [Natronospira proteinivora]|uniref:diguanylate cyclase n=1 Tax=Natronospira proteinivora TaxID=1807133 RepID=A0ABT1GBA2_9GAMM|nr:sensor domain-containing diguanylate cyclase [Natronospira proteinivora]MCP1728200.1 diguanylate cyclase (GGDEF)-like protein [Natronospira proteinivora]
MLELHRDHKQALRIRRVMLGLVAYLMWMLVSIYLYLTNLVDAGVTWLAGYFLLMLLTNAVFILAIRRDWNLRFNDPGMTLGQISFGIFWGMVLLAQTLPEARGGVLLVFVTSFFFGVFRLTTRQFLLLTAFASLAYAGLIRLDWSGMDLATRRTELSQWLFLTIVLLWMSFMGGYVARLRANLRAAMGRIEELANRDHLTGAGNRRAITGSLDTAIQACRDSGQTLSVLLLDLDRFKQLNDQHGHLTGDAVLKEFVQRVESALRGHDFIESEGGERLGRFGGEEFLVVLPSTNLEGARQAAERLRQMVEQAPFETEGGPVEVTVSIGLSEYRAHDEAETLLKRADQALYRAKDKGRNRVEMETGE